MSIHVYNAEVPVKQAWCTQSSIQMVLPLARFVAGGVLSKFCAGRHMMAFSIRPYYLDSGTISFVLRCYNPQYQNNHVQATLYIRDVEVKTLLLTEEYTKTYFTCEEKVVQTQDLEIIFDFNPLQK